MLENPMGYSAWLVDSIQKETITAIPLSGNKASFKPLWNHFRSVGRSLPKSEEKEKQLLATTPAASTTTHPVFHHSPH